MQTVNSAGKKFPGLKRLLRHGDFQRVYEFGRRQFTGNMTVFFLRRSEAPDETGSSIRVGFTVGRVLGGAVERNRIRRRMREAVRLNWPLQTAPVDIVFHPRTAVLDLPFEDVAQEVARGLQLALERARTAGEARPVKRK
jgi:ribonuclease P protein component